LIVLDRVDRNRMTLDTVLDDAAPMMTDLTRRDRALFNQLVYGVLRQRLRLDAVVGRLRRPAPVKISPVNPEHPANRPVPDPVHGPDSGIGRRQHGGQPGAKRARPSTHPDSSMPC
jgi:hypothetical protein